LWPLAVVVAVLLALNSAGADYYFAPVEARVRHPLHAWFRPSGFVGQTAGIVALLIFVFLWLYPLRKKWKRLAFTGSIGRWLDVHVTTALTLPLLLALHSAWRTDGLIGLGSIAMLIVCASGVVGRYLYTHIPRAKNGVELTRDEVAREREQLHGEIAAATGLTPAEVSLRLRPLDARAGSSVSGVFASLVANDIVRWRLMRELRADWSRARGGNGRAPDRQALGRAIRLAGRDVALSQQLRMLDATQRVFRFWHVAHRPFAISALLAVVVHVSVVVAVGATWFW
jgi:hypothetical protein